jgi:signal transduction histidine kinase/ActR/RegA family two-component response regulator
LNSTLDLETLLDLLVVEALDLIHAESGVAGLLTPAGMTCSRYYQKGVWLPLEYCWPAMHGLPGWLITHKVPYLTNEALTDTQIVHELCVQFGVHQALSTPIMSARGEILGFFEIHNKTDGPGFTRDDQDHLMSVSQVAAIAIQNALAYRDLQHAQEDRVALLEREQAARLRAEEASRLKDEFLATVSHELRTPLNAIIGWSHMLRNGELDEATALRAVETIERNARAQAQLIEDILDVSRVITGKLRLQIEPVDMTSVVGAAVDAVRLAADSKGIQLEVTLEPEAIQASGDAGRLQQIVWNLLSNAIKFTPGGGRVEVWLKRAETDLLIVVRDSGEGISPDFLPLIFDRFRQADGSMTRRHGGLGLGLAIVRHLVELHGGSVSADSPGAGLGATFTIRLPLATAHERMNPGAEVGLQGDLARTVDRSASQSLDGVRVLLVDDDQDTLNMLTVVLARHGATTQTVASVAEALKFLALHTPDVLVSDLAMPSEDGYTLIGKVRELESGSGKRILAVALTANVRIEDRTRALSAGFNMFVPKPVEPGELIAAIKSLLTTGPAGWNERLRLAQAKGTI